jgi:hypothetical protein
MTYRRYPPPISWRTFAVVVVGLLVIAIVLYRITY